MAEVDPNWFAGIPRWLASPGPWTLLALVGYLATLTLGVLSLSGRPIKRAWHTRLFVLTCALTALAAILSFPEHWVRGLALALALVPLGLLPVITRPVARRPGRHIAVGLAAAPCYLVAVALWAAGAG
jgi:hypothetical protein